MNRDKGELVAIAMAAFVTLLQAGLQVWMWFEGQGPTWQKLAAIFAGAGAS